MKKSECVLYVTKIREDVDYDRLFEEYESRFEPERVKRINRTRNDKVRKSLIATGCTLMSVFSDYGIDSCKVDYGILGKPYVKGKRAFFFNISHSGDFVIVATSGQEIGADIQKTVAYNEQLVRKIMSEKEREQWSERIGRELHYMWAAKESYSKLTGNGISTDFSRLSFSEDNDKLTYYEGGKIVAYGQKANLFDNCAIVVCGRATFEIVNIRYLWL